MAMLCENECFSDCNTSLLGSSILSTIRGKKLKKKNGMYYFFQVREGLKFVIGQGNLLRSQKVRAIEH